MDSLCVQGIDLRTDRHVLLVAGILVIPAPRYSILILQAPMAVGNIVIRLVFPHLVRRFVPAHERAMDDGRIQSKVTNF